MRDTSGTRRVFHIAVSGILAAYSFWYSNPAFDTFRSTLRANLFTGLGSSATISPDLRRRVAALLGGEGKKEAGVVVTTEPAHPAPRELKKFGVGGVQMPCAGGRPCGMWSGHFALDPLHPAHRKRPRTPEELLDISACRLLVSLYGREDKHNLNGARHFWVQVDDPSLGVHWQTEGAGTDAAARL